MKPVNPAVEPLSADDVLLVPAFGTVESRSDVQVVTEIFSAPMDTVTGHSLSKAMLEHGGHPVLCRNLPEDEWVQAIRDFHGHPDFWIAMDASLSQLQTLAKMGLHDPCNVAIDIAHGYSVMGLRAVKQASEHALVRFVMTGSIATNVAGHDLVHAGATHLRVGIGPGSACTTRLMTGVGVPQLTAVAQMRYIDHPKYDVKVIADGGIRNPGDAVKYLAAGADGIMMGGVFSKTYESHGWDYHGDSYRKSYRGHASAAFQKDHFGNSNVCPEGASGPVFEWDGETTVESVLRLYRGGIASACSYLGCSSSQNLEGSTFIRNTPSGILEGQPHGVK